MAQLNVSLSDDAREFILKQSDRIAIRMQLVPGC